MKNHKFSIGKIIYVFAILALSLLLVLFILEKSQVINFYERPTIDSGIESVQKPVNIIDYSPADPTDNDEINQKKSSGEIDDSTPPVSSGKPINVVLTAATQDKPGGPIVVRVLLNDTTEGKCVITVSNETVSKTYTKNVINAGTYYNCEALDIPVSDINEGSWLVQVDVTNGDRFGSAQRAVEVKL